MAQTDMATLWLRFEIFWDFVYFKANFSHKYISLLRKHETLQDAFIHSSSGPPTTCLRQFCEKVGSTCFSHITQDTWKETTPVKEIKKYQCHILSLPWSLISFFLIFWFFWYFLYFFTFSHLCTGRSTYLLATAKKQLDHPSCNIHTDIHSHIHACRQITRHVTFTLTFIRTFIFFVSEENNILFLFYKNLLN